MKITNPIRNKFNALVGEKQISSQKDQLEAHAKDMSFHKRAMPELIIWTKTKRQVSNIIKTANRYHIPVTAWGGGSSLEGNPIPVNGGIVLDMTHMNKILEIKVEDLQVRVQPGIIGEDLDKQLRPYNVWVAAAPGSKHLATIGGIIANNAGGMHAVKYGVVADAVLQLEVVL